MALEVEDDVPWRPLRQQMEPAALLDGTRPPAEPPLPLAGDLEGGLLAQPVGGLLGELADSQRGRRGDELGAGADPRVLQLRNLVTADARDE